MLLSSPYSDSLSLRLPYPVKLATERKSLTHYTKGTQSPHEGAPTVCMHTVSGSISLPSRGSFAFPSRYWFTIGRLRVFSLGGWSPHLQTGFHVSRLTCRMLSTTDEISNTGLSPTMAEVSNSFFYLVSYHIQPPPCSLTTTYGISIDFFSSGYLDNSVLRVRFSSPIYSDWDTHYCVGFPIRTSRYQYFFASSTTLFAGYIS